MPRTVPPAPKSSGPRTLNPEIRVQLEERSRLKQCKETWREEFDDPPFLGAENVQEGDRCEGAETSWAEEAA